MIRYEPRTIAHRDGTGRPTAPAGRSMAGRADADVQRRPRVFFGDDPAAQRRMRGS